ncbi:MAG: DHH family phosphoesterase [Clostridia bacterium]|nr:DHH family phosphoesterase [Clostridia bacterium]
MTQRIKDLLGALQNAGGCIAITGHDAADVDSVAACVLARRLLCALGVPCRIALSGADKQSRRVMERFGEDVDAMIGRTEAGDALLLVDHHQTLRPGRVIAVIDHHPTDYPPACPFLLIEERGACTATVLDLMREAGVPVFAQDEKLAVTALYLDTIALRSTKITKQEAAWGEREAKRLGLDEDWLRREGMRLRDMTLPARELALLGRKVYDFGGMRVLSTYVQTDAMTDARLEEIMNVLRAELIAEGAALWVYLVHNPMAMRSTQYDLLPDGSVVKTEYDCLVSRGKDVMPRVEKMMRKAGNGHG